jgi:N6-L-threonylcarbamoyladenine synthase
LAASFQAAVIDSLVDRAAVAMAAFKQMYNRLQKPSFVLAGGVAANSGIRSALGQLAGRFGFQLRVPPAKLCTDNGAMIAWAGVERASLARFDDLSISPRARWPLAEKRRLTVNGM